MNLRQKITEIMAMEMPDGEGKPAYIPIVINVPLKHERYFGDGELRIGIQRGIIFDNNINKLPSTYQYDIFDQEVTLAEGPIRREDCGYTYEYRYVLHIGDEYLDGKAEELKSSYPTNQEAYAEMVMDCERQLNDMHLSKEDYELVKKHMEEGPFRTMLSKRDDPWQTPEIYAPKAKLIKKYFRQAVLSLLKDKA